jgi:uncharacterized coiled-coil protein SlyX
MFGSKKDTNNKIDKSLYDDKVVELSSARKSMTKLQAQVDNQKDTIEELHGVVRSKETSYSMEVTELKSQMSRLQTSVNARINEALASIGVTHFAIETIHSSGGDETPEVIVRKFNSLPTEARTEFYNKHKDVIDRATRSDIPSVKP